MAGESKVTTNHKKIQKWAEDRGGTPSYVKGTKGGDEVGLLRINFPGTRPDNLIDISWEDFFEKFDEKKLTFLYQEKTKTGKTSRFNKFVSKETAKKVNTPSDKKPAAKNTTSSTKVTTNHKKIQKWAEDRGGTPSYVKGTKGGDEVGLLRINFPGTRPDNLIDISWEDFFEKFNEKKLTFLYQEKTKTGKTSRFNKFVSKETAKKVNTPSDKKPALKKSTSSKSAKVPATKNRPAAKSKGQGTATKSKTSKAKMKK